VLNGTASEGKEQVVVAASTSQLTKRRSAVNAAPGPSGAEETAVGATSHRTREPGEVKKARLRAQLKKTLSAKEAAARETDDALTVFVRASGKLSQLEMEQRALVAALGNDH
jgi:hypothetical protein